MLLSDIKAIDFKHGVPFVIWTFWAGKPMEANRLLSFETLQKNIGVPIFLITPQNWHQLELPNFPFHQAFPYLSVVHQSDYIRIYLLHHYGGAWHDIKATDVSFAECWDKFENPSIYMIGRQESKNGPAKVYDANGNWMPDFYEDLISVTAWIGRGKTPLSEELLNQLHLLLDENLALLKKYPAKHPRERALKATNTFGKAIEKVKNLFAGRQNNYPLPWTVFGNLFHPLNLKYKESVSTGLPVNKVKNAGIYHR